MAVVAETGSTNADLLEAAAAGALEGTWLRAERQSGGRGRLGRVWQSPPGNLYASTIVRLGMADPPAPELALVAGVALHDAASTFADGGAIRLKWPNDLTADGAKLAGILVERTGDALVIGFGVNLAHHPEGLDRPVTSLLALSGTAPPPDDFATRLRDALARWVARWRGEGFASVRAAWLERAHPLGTPLRAATAAGTVEGAFGGLSADGALRLVLADGSLEEVRAGDVFLV
nr:biotin--[acetyl-CoA-carboxylase] ligase [Sphingomonas nostoxanthinifaciens]